MVLEAGTRLGAFEVLGPLGAGGMGEVYRARDTKLGREVALKLLPESFAADPKRLARFDREARALAALNHPGIAAIYGLEEHGDSRFLVLELVRGETLAERLARGPLPPAGALEVFRQIAEALEAAHGAGLIHRDLKPANLMLTPEGRVKLLDFGLAKAVEPPSKDGDVSEAPTAELLTVETAIVGTLGYLSPEQVRGQPLDRRSDVWSFGCVLYEALTGRRPFQAPTEADTLASVLDREPDWSALPPETPDPVRSLLRRCLRKDRDERTHDVADVRIELQEAAAHPSPRRIPRSRGLVPVALLLLLAGLAYFVARGLATRTETGRVMLAVLPFENLSGDSEQDYFSDGLTEEMIAQLGGLNPERLGVIARTSVLGYEGSRKPVKQIARELGVDYLVEGSVRSAGRRVRITVQLVRASDQTHLWAKSYERALDDVFGIQSEVADRIASALELQLLPGAPRARVPTSPAAHEAYLRGRYQWNKRTSDGFRRAIEEFERAIAEDPGYARAYTGLADTYLLMAAYGEIPHEEAGPKAKQLALRALELDEGLAEAHVSLSGVLWEHEHDFAGGERELRRAIELNANYATAYHWYASLLAALGRFDEGIVAMQKARELDPLSLRINVDLGRAYYFARRYDEAVAIYQRTLELDPEFRPTHSMLGLAYAETGRHDEAIARIKAGVSRDILSIWLGYAYAKAGHDDEARQLLERWRARWDESGEPGATVAIALIHVGLGEIEAGLDWVETAYDAGEPSLYMVKAYPYWDPLRSEPRFERLIRRMQLPPGKPAGS